MLFWFKSAKKYNKSIPTQSETGPLCVWKFQKDRANFDAKSWPLGKGSTVKIFDSGNFKFDAKSWPLGKGSTVRIFDIGNFKRT